MLDPRPSRSGAAAGRAHSDDGCDHLSYARARAYYWFFAWLASLAAEYEAMAEKLRLAPPD